MKKKLLLLIVLLISVACGLKAQTVKVSLFGSTGYFSMTKSAAIDPVSGCYTYVDASNTYMIQFGSPNADKYGKHPAGYYANSWVIVWNNGTSWLPIYYATVSKVKPIVPSTYYTIGGTVVMKDPQGTSFPNARIFESGATGKDAVDGEIPRFSYSTGSPTTSAYSLTATLNVPYNLRDTVNAFGWAPYTYGVASGSTLPAGFSINSTTGLLSGTPAAAGTYTFSLTATDSYSGTNPDDGHVGPFIGKQLYTLHVALVFTTPSPLPSTTVGASYSQTIQTTGGMAPTYAVTSGALPAGLTLSSAGVISGTPTAGGSFNFTITATDAANGGSTGSQAYTLTVNPATITVSPTTLPNATVGSNYNQAISGSGGTAPYTYSITAGALPAGLTLASNGTLSGTPTAGGTFNFTIKATDSSTGTGPYNSSQAYTLTVNPAIITLSPATLPNAQAGAAYNQAITASGGTGPYTYSLTAGALPAGLSLSSSGTLSGTPTAGGTFNFTVMATDVSTGTGPYTGSQAYTLTVNPATITLSPAALPAAAVAGSYSQSITASGGTAPYTYSITAGALPAGLSLTSGGTLSGTPMAGGTFNVTITATDASAGAGPYTGSQAYTLTVNAPTITLSPTTLPNAQAGASYNQTVSASGGTAPYTYSLTAGALPAGLTLASNGTLSGTPTAGGTFNFTLKATDASIGTGPYTGSQAYTLTVNPASITVSPATLPNATVGGSYSQAIIASAGTAPYTYTVTTGALPAGLSLSSGGTLSGTPTAGGTFSFTVTATDASTGAGPYAGSQAYTLTVNAPTIAVLPATLPNATVGGSYSQAITASGGTAPYTYTITTGALPAGLSLSSGGILSGRPTAGGTFNFTITATDATTGAGPYTGSQAYVFTVDAPAITVSPSSLPSATVFSSYSQTITAAGGTAPYTYSVTSGALPAGLTLAANGSLSGTPTAAGTFNFTVKATDASTGTGPYTGSQAYTLTVNAPTITLSPANLPSATDGVAYSEVIRASGGTAPYTYSVTAGTLPPGLTLAANGTLSGTPTAAGTFNITITANDASTGTGPYTGSQAYTFIVNTPPMTISPASLPPATVFSSYSQTITAAAGTSPYTYSVTSGALPAGLTLAANGSLSGTPTASGTFNFTVTATDASTGTHFSASQAYALTVSPPTITMSPTVLPAATVFTGYNQTLTASGGTAPYTYSITTGALPTGLSLSSGGTISGIPTVPGTYNFTITATDASTGTGPYTGSRAYTITVNLPIIIVSPATLPNPQDGVAYNQTITASGGTAPYTYAVTSGLLPTGLSLSSGGALSGTPTRAGTFNFTITTTDASTGAGPYTGSQVYTVIVGPPTIIFSPATLPGATTGISYSKAITASGGTGPYTYSLTTGALPAGITLASNGTLSGTPTVSGTFSFTIKATDSSTGTLAPFSASHAYTLTVIAFTPATLPNMAAGVLSSRGVTVAGGTAPYTFSVTAGALPPGVTISVVTATQFSVGGKATSVGTFTFTITATDALGNTGSQPYTLTVNPPTFSWSNLLLIGAEVGVSYSSSTINVTNGGTPPYTYTVTSGSSLPPGLTLATNGVLSGTPTTAGVFTFSVTATDASTGSGPYSTSHTYTLPVLNLCQAGVSYTQSVWVPGGVSGYSTTSTLPAGLSLSSNGTLSGMPTQAGTFNLIINALNSTGGTVTYDYAFKVIAPTIVLSPTTLANGAYGSAYSPVTFTATGGTAPYTYSATGLPSGMSINPSTGVLSGTPAAAGTYSVSVKAQDATTGTGAPFSKTNSITFVIDQVPLTITADNQSKVYGSANPTLTASYSGFVNGDTQASLTTQPTITTTTTISSPVGNYAITASGAADPNYTISYIAGNLAVTHAALTITADNQSKVYGSANPALTASYSGFVNGDTQASLTTQPAITTTATTSSPVGNYAITASGAADPNYTISYTDGNLAVTQKNITVTADAQSKTYGQPDPTLSYTFTPALVAGDNFTGSLSRTVGENVGSYAINQGTLTLNSNYSMTYQAANLTIGQAALTITADNQSKVYGSANPTLTANYSGFVNGDNASSLTTQPAITTTATTSSPVGNYVITASGAADANYTISYTDGNLSVTQAALTIKADNQSKVYGSANPTLTASYSGFVNGDTQASLTTQPTISTTATINSPVGSYPITASGAADANYTINYTDGNFSVTPENITVTADAQSKTYGQADPTLSYTFSPALMTGDNFTGSLSRTAGENVGNYPINQGTLALNSNYSLTYQPSNLTIGKAALIIAADNQSKVYGSANPTLTASYSGFVNGDSQTSLTAQPAITTTATTNSPVGSYPITASGAADPNYTISYADGSLTVTQAALTITADNQSKVYGSANPTLMASYSGFVNRDTPSSLTTQPTLTTTATTSSPVGYYTITAGGAADANYMISYAAGSLEVTEAALTIMPNNQSKVYGAANPTLTASYSGFVNGDDVSKFITLPTLTTTATTASATGSYPITAVGAAIPNYTLNYQAGTLTITKASLIATADNQSRDYGKANPVLTISYSGFVNGDDASKLTAVPTASTTAVKNTWPATYPITVGGGASPNYSLSYVPGTLTIVPLKDDTLSGIKINGGQIAYSPDFYPRVYSYHTEVENQVDKVNITTSFDPPSTALINGMPLYVDIPSNDIPLQVGDNIISVTVTAQNGNQHTYTVTIYRGMTASSITANNILTPNGDGKNDTWVVKDIELYPNNTATVYDRAGRVVYSKHGYQNDWGGVAMNGLPLSQGTYFFTVNLGNGGNILKGFITIIRE